MDKGVESSSGPNKKFIFIGGAVLLLFLILILILAASSKKKNTSPEQPSQTTTEGKSIFNFGFGKQEPKKTTQPISKGVNVTASQIISTWIEKQKTNEGIYYYGLLCDKKGICSQPVPDNRAGIAVLWSQFKLYETTKDSKYLSLMTKNINLYSDLKTIETIQNDFWNCKLMYEIALSNKVKQELKDKVKTICLRSTNYPLDEMSSEEKVNKISLKNHDINIDTILQNRLIPTNETFTHDKFIQYSTSASDKAVKYIWNHNIFDLKASQIYFNKTLALYSNNKNILKDEAALLGVASLDLFKMTNNNKYLSLAYYIYKNTSTDTCSSDSGCVGVVFLSSELYNITKENKYKNIQIQTLGYLMDYKLDVKPYRGERSNQEAFYFLNDYSQYIYPIRGNALLVGKLSQ